MAEMQPQLSNELIKIMEQKLLAIERRSACLENLINRVYIMDPQISKVSFGFQRNGYYAFCSVCIPLVGSFKWLFKFVLFCSYL